MGKGYTLAILELPQDTLVYIWPEVSHMTTPSCSAILNLDSRARTT